MWRSAVYHSPHAGCTPGAPSDGRLDPGRPGEVAVGTLAERFPSMTLIDEALVFRRNPQMRDMKSLRVALRSES